MIKHGIPILITVAVGAVLWFALNKFISFLVGHIMVITKGESKEGVKKRKDTLISILTGTGRAFIILIGMKTILSEVGVDIGPALVGFGVAGIAIGFGAQYLIKDLIAGIFIIVEDHYRVGDVVRINSGVGGLSVSGLVEEITLRKTTLRDRNGIVYHISNGEIIAASNFTKHFARVNLDVSVGHDTDLDHAISVMNRVGKELAEDEKWRDIIKSPPQVLWVDNLGSSGISIKILGDVNPVEQWTVAGELRLRLKKAFDVEGIKMFNT
jgi:small conductance mechanosensitive channel